jgi:hypothetical protein
MTYPDRCIRGISQKNFITEGVATSSAFTFYDIDIRQDGYLEQSINWEDDETVIEFTLKQEKNGSIQFKGGVAIIACDQLDDLINRPPIRGRLAYERAPIDDNKYHGNLLLKADTPKPIRRMITGGIALTVEEQILRA